MIGLIWAEAAGGIIGNDGVMPWHLPEDLAHFKRTTAGSAVIMGRKTWDSLPERFRPLADRRNIVITRQTDWRADGVDTAHSIDEALALAGDLPVWVIGGAQIFDLVIDRADRLEVTEIRADVAGDTHAPTIGPRWHTVAVDAAERTGDWQLSRTGLEYRFVRYEAR